jgi:C4-dicarboxylate-specific signal transduction histidine kinase
VTQQAISAIRNRAGQARRLSNENKQAEAKAALLQIASLLEADADQLEAAVQHEQADQNGDE